MKRSVLLGAACALLAGCDFTAPLIPAPGAEADAAMVGAWVRAKPDGVTERLLVLPLGRAEYLVSFPARTDSALFARAWLGQVKGRRLVQLEWIGTAEGKRPDSPRVFQVVSYALTNGTLDVRLLNADVVGHDAQTPKALARALTDHADDPALFREPMVFRRDQ